MVYLGHFKKTIFISVLGHITMFGIFSLSFGYRLPKADYANVFFLGSILRSSDLNSQTLIMGTGIGIKPKPLTLVPDSINKEYALVLPQYSKPEAPLPLDGDKVIFTPKPGPPSLIPARKESVIMFYPALPYHFLLYFKDRQTVHIELMFNIIPTGSINSIDIKRKISSGNLEVDLLAMRYIRHYLFIQQKTFSQNSWQTVKIDLIPHDD